MFRVASLREVEFYNAAMIAADDSERWIRLRQRGWRVLRFDSEMTLHDAAIGTFGRWCRGTRRSGHGFGAVAYLHPDPRVST